MVVARKEGGAIIYQAYAFHYVFEWASGQEGPQPETAVGQTVNYGMMMLPMGAMGKGGKVLKGVDAAQDVGQVVKFSVKTDPKLLKLARETFEGNQALRDEVNNVLAQVSKGNMNPGKGTKYIDFGVFEFRSENARIYFRNNQGGVEIIGYSNKKNQADVISRIRQVYK